MILSGLARADPPHTPLTTPHIVSDERRQPSGLRDVVVEEVSHESDLSAPAWRNPEVMIEEPTGVAFESSAKSDVSGKSWKHSKEGRTGTSGHLR